MMKWLLEVIVKLLHHIKSPFWRRFSPLLLAGQLALRTDTKIIAFLRYSSLTITSLFFFIHSLSAEETFTVGCKRFTESYILGEIIKQTAVETAEAQVIFKPGLGSTGIAFAALEKGAIDLYPEYTGTIAQELLKSPSADLAAINAKLHPQGIGAAILLGFNNAYAIAMLKQKAEKLDIRRISDLLKLPHLQLGFSPEFLKRIDGFEELRRFYHLPQHDVHSIDHALSYEALISGQIDLIDIYSTDPKIDQYRLLVLEDDLHFFPSYDALLLYRLEVPRKFPKIWSALKTLENRISNEAMLQMNAKGELSAESFEHIAKGFLTKDDSPQKISFFTRLSEFHLWDLTKQHLFLVFASLIPAIFFGIPLGISAAYSPSCRHIILNGVAVIQTIPSLALFALLIPLLQMIGTVPALIALFFYALLPIVRNTYAGLSDIPKILKESAIVLGLPPLRRLALVEIPLASRTILAGIKTAAVINVGMATIAAFIGAGGLGDLILTGLALNNSEILLWGAIPACLLAIFVQLGFDLLDDWLVPKGLK
jgi:osmoprotectant transport system permease protein